MGRTAGLHHVTALASDPRRNLAFYTGLLGLRLVKRTVNFDDPGTWHLYYGDARGTPGTILTFFAWPGAYRGTIGAGEVDRIAFAVPAESTDFWRRRLAESGSLVDDARNDVLATVRDPDGLTIEFVPAPSGGPAPTWSTPDIPRESAISGLGGLTLRSRNPAATSALLSEVLGLTRPEADTFVATGDRVGRIGMQDASGGRPGMLGAGSVHHIAWRVPDESAQLALRDSVTATGIGATEILDRKYFQSVYFREPGGILFELATEGPGFLVDEPAESLGETLQLPAWLEADRARIAARLPPLEVAASQR